MERRFFRPEPSRAPHWAGGLVLVAALTAGGCASSEPELAAVTLVDDEPGAPIDVGPPMIPTAVVDEPRDELVTGPVDPTSLADDEDPRPTAEQRALTEQKQQAAIPPVQHLRGRIAIPRGF